MMIQRGQRATRHAGRDRRRPLYRMPHRLSPRTKHATRQARMAYLRHFILKAVFCHDIFVIIIVPFSIFIEATDIDAFVHFDRFLFMDYLFHCSIARKFDAFSEYICIGKRR